jgi:hypothetical protein
VGVGCGDGGGSEPSLLSPPEEEDGGDDDWADEAAGLSSSAPSSLTDLLLDSVASFSGSDGAGGVGLLFPDQRGEDRRGDERAVVTRDVEKCLELANLAAISVPKLRDDRGAVVCNARV